MKKRLFERALVVVAACAVCVGVTSCGNDAKDQPAPPAPPAASPAPETPAAEPSAPAATPSVAAPEPAPEPAQDQFSNPPPSPPQAAEKASVAPADTDVTFNIDKLEQVAKRQGADFLTPARAYAGSDLKRKLWVCAIAQRAGRVADLIVLAREARAACTGPAATFGNLYRVARYFEAASAFNEAWEALDKGFARAREENIPKERQEEAKKLFRRLSRAK